LEKVCRGETQREKMGAKGVQGWKPFAWAGSIRGLILRGKKSGKWKQRSCEQRGDEFRKIIKQGRLFGVGSKNGV